jgi:hypothetical protein
MMTTMTTHKRCQKDLKRGHKRRETYMAKHYNATGDSLPTFYPPFDMIHDTVYHQQQQRDNNNIIVITTAT